MNVLYLIDVLMKQEKTNDECLRIYSYRMSGKFLSNFNESLLECKVC